MLSNEFFNCFDPELRAVIKDCMYIDKDRYPYFWNISMQISIQELSELKLSAAIRNPDFEHISL